MTTIKDIYAPSNEQKKEVESQIKTTPIKREDIREEQKERASKAKANRLSFSKLFSFHFNFAKWTRSIKQALSYLNYLRPSKLRYYLSYYYEEYKRILVLSKKPDAKEFKELSLVVIISALMSGALGLIIELIFFAI
jgi:preprotein translocase subunit Sss1